MESVFRLLGSASLSSSSLPVRGGEHLRKPDLNSLAQFELGKRSGEAIDGLSRATRKPKAKAKDKKALKASLSPLSSVTGGSTYDFSVTYKDNKGIKANSLGKGDILVTGNGFSQVASLVSKSSSSKGKIYKVIYRITAPGGTWDAVDNGSYGVALRSKQVSDTSRNFAAAKNLGAFSVTIPPIVTPPSTVVTPPSTVVTPPSTVEKVAPTASLSAASLTTGGGNTYDFTITYSDNVAVNVSSIDNSDILVSGPNGFSQLATRIPVNDASNGTPRTVTYRITAPGGTWDSADNSIYSVALQANQVADTSGNFATAATLGSFQVNIPRPSLRFSGSANGAFYLDFTLDTSVQDTDTQPGGGLFENALSVTATSGLDGSVSSGASNITVRSYLSSSSSFDFGKIVLVYEALIYGNGGGGSLFIDGVEDFDGVDHNFFADELTFSFDDSVGDLESLVNTLEPLEKALFTNELSSSQFSSQFSISLSGFEELIEDGEFRTEPISGVPVSLDNF